MLATRRPPTCWSALSLNSLRFNTIAYHSTIPGHVPSLSPRKLRLNSPKNLKLGLARPLHTSSPRLGIPSVGPNGQVQSQQYLAALELINSRLATEYPDGRAVYSPKKEPTTCPPLPIHRMAPRFNLPATKGRCSLIEPEAARAFVRGALGLDERPKRGRKRKDGRVIVEAFPGPGGVTRALLELPRSEVKRVIVLEEELKYLPALKELEYFDDRVHVLPHSGFIWETYDIVKDLGLLDGVQVEDWKTAPHSTLSFIGHLPLGPVGEQLIAQLLRAIPERSWLFKYGRMRMSWLLAHRMLERITSPPQRAARCKLTLVSEATADVTLAMPMEMIEDYDICFWPKAELLVGGKKKTPLPRRIGQPFVAVNIDPLAEGSILSRDEAKELQGQQIATATKKRASKALAAKEETEQPGIRVTLEKWDYVLRQLFILKSTPLEKAIQNLGPGASSLLNKLTGPDVPESRKVDIKAPVNALSLSDFGRIVEEFHKWPFAPDVLFIADQMEEDRN